MARGQGSGRHPLELFEAKSYERKEAIPPSAEELPAERFRLSTAAMRK
jgi:hypothetical protein